MALHYILDGYNIIKCVDAWADVALEQGRQALLAMINHERPQGSLRNAVTVVFDGKDDVWGAPSGGIARVVFTSGQSADDYIKNTVELSQDKKNIVVVSNDKEIVCYARKLGTKVMDVRKFLSHKVVAHKGVSRRKNYVEKDHKTIDSSMEYRINKEFENIWLRKKSEQE